MKLLKSLSFAMALILFLIFPSTANTAYASDTVVTLGGCAIGIELNLNGVAIIGVEEGERKLEAGDIILKIDNKKITNISELKSAVEMAQTKVVVTVDRGGKEIKVNCEVKSGEKGNTLGILVKDTIRGVGTLTFVKEDKTFASLGHQVSIGKGKTPAPISSGALSGAYVLGVVKGEKGKAGEIKAVFALRKDLKGEITSNTELGVYGKLTTEFTNPIYKDKVKVAKSSEIKLGKATILTTIEGKNMEEYEIEIISKSYQPNKSEKGMVIKVTDSRLLEKTGGIVQGMSGSPIIQEGKLVGAVTHVFINDSTRGYGLYSEFML